MTQLKRYVLEDHGWGDEEAKAMEECEYGEWALYEDARAEIQRLRNALAGIRVVASEKHVAERESTMQIVERLASAALDAPAEPAPANDIGHIVDDPGMLRCPQSPSEANRNEHDWKKVGSFGATNGWAPIYTCTRCEAMKMDVPPVECISVKSNRETVTRGSRER
jgi:hypothetical protein